jgi:hypothetical protein
MIGWHQSPPSCPGLSRASTAFLPPVIKDVDGRDEPGHDDGDAPNVSELLR